ncbi:hypothetical protein J4444_00795 [Candidatus Woesearchaeota archaeon]|nr:hypothetical protein [Candidatus Woesearchaeota archaeon]
MDKESIKKALDLLKQQPKRGFVQTYDLVINLKNFDVKTHPVDFFAVLPHPKGKKIKIAAFVDQELVAQSTKFCDVTLRETDFEKYKNDKKLAKKLGEDYDFFIAQANLMAKVAAAFGKVLGTKGKMPNPKLGCVVPPTANLEPLVKRLNLSVRLSAKKGMNLQCLVGKEDQPDEQIIDNIFSVYQAVLKQVPDESQNIKNVALKLTMGKPVRI